MKICRFLLAMLALTAGGALAATVKVTITQAAPIEELDSTGHPCGVSKAVAGSTYSLIAAEGDSVVLQNDSGTHYRVALTATDYVPPAPAPAAQVSVSSPVPATPATAVSTNPAPATATPVVKVESTPAGPVKQLNDALGIPLLSNVSFWKDDVAAVAQRLGWPQESKTTTEESYRRYAREGEAKVLGTSAYSLALYGKQGKPTYVSLIFANAGDFAEVQDLPTGDGAASEKARNDLARAVKKDAETISAALTSILGNPSITLYGNSSSNRDEVHRWDAQGISILLNSHQGEYASIKIVPVEAADHFGTVDVTDRSEMRDILAQRVVKRPNGDVVISELPMVDQGPKGYCVPATWERYLRYMDVPADLYVLAIMGNSGLGGGTSVRRMQAGVNDYVSAYHRRIETYDAPLDVVHVARYIDQGLPLMWACWISKTVEQQTNKNTHDRQSVTDWDAYAKQLVTQDAGLGPSFQAEDPDRQNGHMRMIIGYNATTKEIAISDSWGSSMAERWLYVGTADRISQGDLAYLSW